MDCTKCEHYDYSIPLDMQLFTGCCVNCNVIFKWLEESQFKAKGVIMNVSEIVKKYLVDNGFDGLCGEECGCGINDLFPCEGDNNPCNCEPAYKHTSNGCNDCDNVDCCTIGDYREDKCIYYSTVKPTKE